MEHKALVLDCTDKAPEVIAFEIAEAFHNQDLHNCLITLRLKGTVQGGKVGNINFKDIFEKLMSQGAYCILKNTAKLQSEEFEEIALAQQNPEDIEEALIKEHLQQVSLFGLEKEKELTKTLLTCMNTMKNEGETSGDFQARIESEMNKLLEL